MKLLTPKQIADQLCLKPDTIQRYIRSGRIPGRCIAGKKRKRYVVTEEDFEAYVLGGGPTVPEPDPMPPRPRERGGFPLLEKYGYKGR